MSSNELVLVTGGSGFVGCHCVLQLLQKGYRVRTTVRSLKKSDDIRRMLIENGVSETQANGVEFAEADLSQDNGWNEACRDCLYVHHVASPFPLFIPKNEDELIIPARDGTLRVLRAAKASGTVRRVIITSSFAAIGYGHKERAVSNPFTEKDWTNLDNPSSPVPPYPKSKTIAEKAAWDWIAKEGGDMELTVVNPVGIFGPILGKAGYSTSIEVVARLMNGSLPGIPALHFGIVDVRDVIDLHIRCMTDPRAKGERFLAIAHDASEDVGLPQMARCLKERLGQKARKVPTMQLPNFVLRLVALFDSSVKMVIPELGKPKPTSNVKAKTTMGWQPINWQDSVVASAESLDKYGFLK